MNANLIIDDQLMETVLKLGNFKTKNEAVEEGLRLLVRVMEEDNIYRFRNKLIWEGDLEMLD